MNKFDGFPSWRMISLRECEDRREKMVEQFERYGVRDYHFYLTHRLDQFKSPLNIRYHHEQSVAHHGTTISHLENMRQWYLTTNEPYAIFSDDDIDLSYSEHWNFSWKDFLNALPGWECVQLTRFMNIHSHKQMTTTYDASLKLMWGRWWGVCALMTRDYVRKCLDRHIVGPFSYDLRVALDEEEWSGNMNCISYVENVLFLDNGRVMNFPLFGELENDSTIPDPDHEKRFRIKRYNFNIYRGLWKLYGQDLKLSVALDIENKDESPYGVTDNTQFSED